MQASVNISQDDNSRHRQDDRINKVSIKDVIEFVNLHVVWSVRDLHSLLLVCKDFVSKDSLRLSNVGTLESRRIEPFKAPWRVGVRILDLPVDKYVFTHLQCFGVPVHTAENIERFCKACTYVKDLNIIYHEPFHYRLGHPVRQYPWDFEYRPYQKMKHLQKLQLCIVGEEGNVADGEVHNMQIPLHLPTTLKELHLSNYRYKYEHLFCHEDGLVPTLFLHAHHGLETLSVDNCSICNFNIVSEQLSVALPHLKTLRILNSQRSKNISKFDWPDVLEFPCSIENVMIELRVCQAQDCNVQIISFGSNIRTIHVFGLRRLKSIGFRQKPLNLEKVCLPYSDRLETRDFSFTYEFTGWRLPKIPHVLDCKFYSEDFVTWTKSYAGWEVRNGVSWQGIVKPRCCPTRILILPPEGCVILTDHQKRYQALRRAEHSDAT